MHQHTNKQVSSGNVPGEAVHSAMQGVTRLSEHLHTSSRIGEKIKMKQKREYLE